MATPGSADVVDEQEPLLSGDFSIFPRKKTEFHVKLSQKAILFRPAEADDKNDKIIFTSDVIGCHCRQGGAKDDSSAYFTVYAYPFRKKLFSGKKTRQRQCITFDIHDFESYEENRKVAAKWRRVILCLAQGIKVTGEGIRSCAPVNHGKLKVLVNPHSGSGKALQIFQKQVVPMLDEADIKYDLITTVAEESNCSLDMVNEVINIEELEGYTVIVLEYAGHAKDLVGNMELSECYGVVIVSGDGLVYEVVNGLMARADWDKAIKMPLGVLPGGSGNALCCSINYSAGEPMSENIVLHSTFVLIKHKVLPMDLVCIETHKERVYSFLSTCIGFIADVDYESEKYRNLGGARFTVGALKRIMGLKTYRMKVSYLPIAEYEQSQPNGQPAGEKVLRKLRSFSLKSKTESLNAVDSNGLIDAEMDMKGDKLRSYSVPGAGLEDLHLQDGEEPETGGRDRSQSEHQATKLQTEEQLFSSLLQDSPGTDAQTEASGDLKPGDVPRAEMSTSEDSLFSDNGVIRETVTAIKTSNAPVPTPLLPPLSEPVPDNWVTVEDEFITVAATYQSHLSDDCMMAPQGRLSEGFVYVTLLRKAGVTRGTLLNLFTSMAEGAHVDSPHVETIRALAFRIEPLCKEGVIMVDGEMVEFGPIQGHILPQLARIMAIQ